jgi:outer membrane immunogenic protein
MQSGARRILFAAGAVICVTTCVLAKDAPRPVLKTPPPIVATDKWSGPYVGLVAGGADGHSSAASIVGCPSTGFLCDPVHYPQNGALLSATASGTKSIAAFTGGALGGYNWHLGGLLLGVETDVSYLRLRVSNGGSAASLNLGLVNPAPPPSGGTVPVVTTVSATAAIDWLATFRGRLGFVLSPDLLMYATGGLALTGLSVSNSYTDNWVFNGGALGSSTVTSTATGYAVGGGLEWSVRRSWTLRMEYLRVAFGSLTTSSMITVVQVPAAKNPFTSSANLTADLFRSGLSHKF